jgi:hypothetical protein
MEHVKQFVNLISRTRWERNFNEFNYRSLLAKKLHSGRISYSHLIPAHEFGLCRKQIEVRGEPVQLKMKPIIILSQYNTSHAIPPLLFYDPTENTLIAAAPGKILVVCVKAAQRCWPKF